MKRKRSSPNAPESEKRNTVVTIRFSIDELARLDAAALRQRVLRSDVIRSATLAAIARTKK